MFDCPATSVQRDTMFDEIRSALRMLRNVLSLPDALTKLLRFVSDDVTGAVTIDVLDIHVLLLLRE
jgi:hypothetical protein